MNAATKKYLLVLGLGIPLLHGCQQSKQVAANAQATATPSDSNASAGGNDAYYTGYDGNTDFSILLPRFRSIVVKDPSIAKIEAVTVTLSATIIDQLVLEAKAANSAFEETRFREKLGKQQTTYRITPLKAGKTVLVTSGGRGGAPGKSQSGFSKSVDIDLIVSPYTIQQQTAGKARYDAEGSGTLTSCKSCHETGEENAPPHELGRIMEISDSEALSWVKTGEIGSRSARIPHAWEFSSDEEESGIVPYLRSKQTHDVETLTKLVVEEQLANGGFMGPPVKK